MRYIDIKAKLPTQRLVSLDALRGFNFIWILGGDGAVIALADMMRAHGGTLAAAGNFLRAQMTHPYWEGLRFYDLIFPLFVFITGVAITLALPKQVEREGKAKAHLRVAKRALPTEPRQQRFPRWRMRCDTSAGRMHASARSAKS